MTANVAEAQAWGAGGGVSFLEEVRDCSREQGAEMEGRKCSR